MALTIAGIEEDQSLIDVDILHPEILTKTQLYCLLKRRNVPVDSHEQDKSKLLELFYHTVLPLPQRDYRLNRRGQLLMRKRAKNGRKRKSETPTLLLSSEKQMEPSMKSPRITTVGSSKSPEVTSRLKPPPSPLSAERKTIRFNTTSCNGSDEAKSSLSVPKGSKVIKMINETLRSNLKVSNSNGSEGKVFANSEKSKEDETPPRKKHKPITWP